MGRYSDSDDEQSRKLKKKKKRRSRSRSRSAESSGSRYSHGHKHKKSKKKHRLRSRSYSRSPDRHGRRSPGWRRRSRSPERSRRSRSSERSRRSRSYERRRRSRSYSRERRSPSDNRDRMSSRRRSTSRERSRRSRSDSGSRGHFDSRRSSAERKKGRRSSSPSHTISNSESNTLDEIPGFKDMTPAEQAQLRLKMALRAATMSDKKLKEAPSSSSQNAPSSPLSRQQFAEAVASIDADSFVPTTFKSSRSSKALKENREVSELPSHTMAMFGAVGNSVVFTKTEPVDKSSLALEDNPDTLFDSSVIVDPEVKMDRWILKLTAMRRKKLEGEIIHSY